jgi:hypothetical protein
MTTVSDNFVRADNPSIGPNWNVVPHNSGSIELKNNSFAPAAIAQTSFPTSFGVWAGGQSFNPYQYSSVKVTQFAPQQSIVNITAASQSGSTTTYTYTLTSGAALQNPQGIIVTGMADGGNNGAFLINGLGAGTFSVNNPSGVTRGGQAGTGTSATDSLCGPLVRASADGANGYFVYIGNNSGYAGLNGIGNDNRLFVREVWKLVNNVSTEIVQQLTSSTMADVAGDIYHLFALGSKIALYKNKVALSGNADTDIPTGRPGIIASTIQTAGLTFPFGSNVGVDGTQFSNFMGSDLALVVPGWSTQATENFLAPGPAPNPPWSQVAGLLTVPTFANGEVICNSGSMVHTARAWANNQASSVVVANVVGNTSVAVVVRSATAVETFYIVQFIFTNGLGPGTLFLQKFIAGTPTTLNSVAMSVNFADVIRIEAIGTSLAAKVNGATILTASDAAIASGSPGVVGGGAAAMNFWTGDELHGVNATSAYIL